MFLERRDVLVEPGAAVGGNAEDTHFLRFGERLVRHGNRDVRFDMAARQRRHAIGVPFERDVNGFHVRRLRESARKNLGRGAGDHADAKLAGIAPGVRNELRHGLPRRIVLHGQRHRVDVDDRNRHVVAQPGRRRHRVLRGHDGGREHAERITVGRRGRDFLGPQHASGARLVHYHHGLAEVPGQILRDDARRQVGAAARRKRHDHAEGLLGIRGAASGARYRQGGRDRDGERRARDAVLPRGSAHAVPHFASFRLQADAKPRSP